MKKPWIKPKYTLWLIMFAAFGMSLTHPTLARGSFDFSNLAVPGGFDLPEPLSRFRVSEVTLIQRTEIEVSGMGDFMPQLDIGRYFSAQLDLGLAPMYAHHVHHVIASYNALVSYRPAIKLSYELGAGAQTWVNIDGNDSTETSPSAKANVLYHFDPEIFHTIEAVFVGYTALFAPVGFLNEIQVGLQLK